MPIHNATKKTLVCLRFEECDSFWEQTRGMMFRERIVPLVFNFSSERILRLHSWFCPGEMDLVLLSDAWEVVELRSDWPAKSKFTSKNKAKFLLELPPGTIAHADIEVGDFIHIKR